jgi:hypothetical protein
MYYMTSGGTSAVNLEHLQRVFIDREGSKWRLMGLLMNDLEVLGESTDEAELRHALNQIVEAGGGLVNPRTMSQEEFEEFRQCYLP